MTAVNQLSYSPASAQWQRIGIKPHHGINIPLFSLHSKNSCGIGEYTDLIPLLHWCKEIGYDVIQLLPLNDTGVNPSPYSAISAFALNPLHLGLKNLPYLEQHPDLIAKCSEMNGMCHSQRVDYLAVGATKDAFLREYYKRVSPQIVTSDNYKSFVQKNAKWLYPYALFKILKINHNWKSYLSWEPDLQKLSQDRYQQLLTQYANEINFHIFVQFLCFEQFKEVKKESDNVGVFLKGDIPILLDRESAEVWWNRRLFHLEFSAGSPPDMYSTEGQNWGSPIYNWEAIQAENYAWWKERLAVADNFYHLYRLDHVLGFFRIWAIPAGHRGSEGKYFPEDPKEYLAQGEQIMRVLLQASPMLPIAEDLGNVPPKVRVCLNDLGICGTKVIRWERFWEKDKSYIPYAEYAQASMTTVSTHDSDTLQLWWKHNPDEAKEYSLFKGWALAPELSHEHHFDILHDSHHTNSLFHINMLQEYLALVPGMTWPNPKDERVNIPGTVDDRNWTYRFRPSVEEIVSNNELKHVMQRVLVA